MDRRTLVEAKQTELRRLGHHRGVGGDFLRLRAPAGIPPLPESAPGCDRASAATEAPRAARRAAASRGVRASAGRASWCSSARRAERCSTVSKASGIVMTSGASRSLSGSPVLHRSHRTRSAWRAFCSDVAGAHAHPRGSAVGQCREPRTIAHDGRFRQQTEEASAMMRRT